jgi:UDP-N-acetylglucosamine 2-epimerase (non-hydrolysing)
MKILTVMGTRPEIIRLSRVIPQLDRFSDHVLVHTGQNYDYGLNEVFFQELSIRRPQVFLEVQGATFGEQVAQILARSEATLREHRPDRLLILGDTNSALSAFVAKRLGIPVYHMEAGNRCYDDRVPEEVNRRVIDHSSDVLMPYTQRSAENLLAEGIPGRRIHVIGNPIYEVLQHYAPLIEASKIMEKLGLSKGKFFLVTMHRQENVDDPGRLRSLVQALERLRREHARPVVVSVHPRTRKRLEEFGLKVDDPEVRLLAPLGLPDFVSLEKNAFCVISDSGTVQEECCIFKVPNVTIRDTTERPETLDCGSNMLSGVEPEAVLRCVRVVTGDPALWQVVPEYLAERVSTAVTKLVLGSGTSP